MDQKLLFLINREWTGPALDRFMALLSSFAAWTPLVVVAVVWALWRGGFRARAFVLTAGLVVGISDGLIAKNLKRAVDRPRPHQVLDGVRLVDLAKATPRLLAVAKPAKVKLSHPTADLEKVDGRSFPSSHTMNTIAVALVAACFYRRWGWLAFVPALLVGYSRVYTGSHWPSDVLTSTFLGLGVGLLLLAIVEMLWRSQAARFFPQLHAAHPSLFTP
jgi:undecaprenyl-diphosphatase